MTTKRNAIFTTLGASNHARGKREYDDYYATDPIAIEEILKLRKPKSKKIWENAAGEGHIADVLIKHGYSVKMSDIRKRRDNIEELNFLEKTDPRLSEKWDGDIITNPPYNVATEWAKSCIDMINEGNEVWLFLKLTFLEGKTRRSFFDKFPPKEIWVSSSRVQCAKGGDFKKFSQTSSAACYAWFIWEKGFMGTPEIHWFN